MVSLSSSVTKHTKPPHTKKRFHPPSYKSNAVSPFGKHLSKAFLALCCHMHQKGCSGQLFGHLGLGVGATLFYTLPGMLSYDRHLQHPVPVNSTGLEVPIKFFWKYLVHSFILQCHKHTSISTRRWNFEFLNIHGKKDCLNLEIYFWQKQKNKQKKQQYFKCFVSGRHRHLGSLPNNTDCRQGQQKRKFDRILLLEPYASQADIPMHSLVTLCTH